MTLQAISADRISALPEPIIHRILSDLPIKSVKLASSLSKTWYDFCSSFPYLDFEDHSVMYADDPIDHEDDIHPVLTPGEIYLNCIGETLRRFHERNPRIPIRRLRIPIVLMNPRYVSLLREWIQLALEHGVEEIDLMTFGDSFNLPGEVFASTVIRVLKLGGCTFLEPVHNGDVTVSSSKLRELLIVGSEANERALRSVISNFPLMEKLTIEDVVGLENIRISGLYKLKSLVVGYSDALCIKMVEVNAPVLHCLELRNSFRDHPLKIGILECPRLVELILDGVEVENFQLAEILSRLPFLRSLMLTKLCLLTTLLISSDSLEELAIISCTDLMYLVINAPNLLWFRFGYNSIPLIAPEHTIMGKSYITLDQESSLYDNFVVKFRNFLSQLNYVNCLCFYLKDLAMISVDDPEGRVVQPVTNIEELNITVQSPNILQDIFNGLLWSYHPRTFRVWLVMGSDDDVAFLRAIMAGVGSCCSSSIHWLPYLESITTADYHGNLIQLPMDGTVPSIAIESFWGVMKFKW